MNFSFSWILSFLLIVVLFAGGNYQYLIYKTIGSNLSNAPVFVKNTHRQYSIIFNSQYPFTLDNIFQTNISVPTIGTLTLPEKKGPYPVAVIFKDDHIVSTDLLSFFLKKEFAIFSLDIGKNKKNPSSATESLKTLVSSAFSSLTILSNHKNIDKTKIIIVGHGKSADALIQLSSKEIFKIFNDNAYKFKDVLAFFPTCNQIYTQEFSEQKIQIIQKEKKLYYKCKHMIDKINRFSKNSKLNISLSKIDSVNSSLIKTYINI